MENRVVIGSLDLNQCISLPDEIIGTKPKVALYFITLFFIILCMDFSFLLIDDRYTKNFEA